MPVILIVGARPNFMKIAPVQRALGQRGIETFLVHTGQHYDHNMSQVFFEQLGMPEPDIHLGVGSGTHARQTAEIMIAFEEICRRRRPRLVIAGGDVNSTIAAALVAAKEQIPLAHVEAGLRSFDRAMPEEVNRVVTDHLSALLFTTEESGNRNLAHEGIAADKIHFVGNCMVDSLLAQLEAARRSAPWLRHGVEPGGYGLLTLHRPSNVDSPETLAAIMAALGEAAAELPIVFPAHPRTRQRLEASAVHPALGLRLLEPLPYLDFLGLMAEARCVLTDSGGIQEETTALDVPCLTLRDSTERPVTVALGTNRLVGTESKSILEAFRRAVSGDWPKAQRPPLWDGEAGDRTAQRIAAWIASDG